MKDIAYANFAQLSYLNWHKFNLERMSELKNSELRKIFNGKEHWLSPVLYNF